MNVLAAGFALTGGVLGYMTSLKYEYNCEQAGNQLGLEKYIYRFYTVTAGAATAVTTQFYAGMVVSFGLSYCMAPLVLAISMLAVSTLIICNYLSPLVPIGMIIYLMT